MKSKNLLCLSLSSLLLFGAISSCNSECKDSSITLNFNETLIELKTKESISLIDYVTFSENFSLLEFSVENEEIVTIDNGELLAKTSGITTVKATYNEYSATLVVNVKNAVEASSLVLNYEELNLNEDQEEQLVYVINPSQARGQKVKFKSTNTSVATVDENGVVKGIKAGKAIIIASLSNGVATGCIVNVNGFEFKDLSTFLTPDEFNMPVKEKCGFQASAVDSGLYLYSYQIATKTYTDNPDNDAKWKNASHVEYEIWNGDLGYGWGGTYVAMWQDGSYYINNEKNVKELRTKVLFTELENGTIKIEYLMFIGFDNNVNSNDPAYAYIKYNFFDAEDNREPYNELDFINFKDDRMVHTHAGNSVSVHDAVDGIDNPHQVTWANKFKTQFTTLGLKRENLTLFVGDSYFEQEGWWTNFYNDYGGKNVFTSAIGGTKSWEWIHYLDELVKPYEDSNGNIQNIVVHLGYNEIAGCNNTLTSEILESHIVALLDKIHSRYNDTNIYYFGIGVSSYFDTISDKKQRSEEVDALTKAYAEKKSWLTFIDTNDIVQQYLNEHAGYTKSSFYKDNTHPKNENYSYFVDSLASAGCVIAEK